MLCVFFASQGREEGSSKELQPVILPLLGIHHTGLIQPVPVVEERIPASPATRLEQYRQHETHADNAPRYAVFPRVTRAQPATEQVETAVSLRCERHTGNRQRVCQHMGQPTVGKSGKDAVEVPQAEREGKPTRPVQHDVGNATVFDLAPAQLFQHPFQGELKQTSPKFHRILRKPIAGKA